MYYYGTRLVIFLLASFFVLGCGSNEKRSTAALPKEKLTALIIEMYLAESKLDAFAIPKDSSIKFFLSREKKILERLGISDSVVQISYQYYLTHPKEYEEVYDAVIDSLNLREQQIK